MNFRNPKHNSFQRELTFENENSFWEKQDDRVLVIPEKKREPEVPVIPFDQQFAFWDCMTDVQYAQFDPEKLAKPNTWVITRNGTWLIQKNKSGYYGLKKNDFGIPTLPETNLPPKFFDLAYGKIPYSILEEVVAFFRGIMKKYNNAEAFVQIYWDTQENKYVVQVPEQNVSGAAVRYNAEKNLSVIDRKRYVFVYECHSHNSMPAFWSGTDDRDEKELRLFGVFGELNTDNYKCLHRFFVGEEQVDVDVNLIFDIPEKKDERKYLVTYKGKQFLVNREELILDEKPKYIFETKDGEKAYIPVTDVVQQKEPEKEFPQEWFNLVNIPKVATSNSDRRWTYDDYDRYYAEDFGGNGHRPRNFRGEALDFDIPTKRYEQRGMEKTQEEIEEEIELMNEEASQLAMEVLNFCNDFEDLAPTIAFIESLDFYTSLNNLQEALKHYKLRNDAEMYLDEGPSDGRYQT